MSGYISQLWPRLERDESFADNFAPFFCLCCENDRITFFPHVDDQGLSWYHVRSEARAHLAHPVRVFFEVMLLHSSRTESFGAKTMKDRLFEASHRGHLWIDVKWVPIAI